MKQSILTISIIALMLLACSKEEVTPSPASYLKATIDGKEIVFNEFYYLGEKANGNSRWQILKASTQNGEIPLRQIYCMINNPRSGINKLIKNGEYDKVRIYYSEDLENYAAWEGVKNSAAEFNLDTIIKTSNAWVYYRTGTFKGKVFNLKNANDSVMIENGTFNFDPYKF